MGLSVIHILEWNGFNKLLSFQHLAEVSCIKRMGHLKWLEMEERCSRSGPAWRLRSGRDWKQKYRRGSGKTPMIKSDYFKILARVSPTHKKSKTGSSSFLLLYKSVPIPGSRRSRSKGCSTEHRVTRNFRSYACYSPTGLPYTYTVPQTIPDILAGGEW